MAILLNSLLIFVGQLHFEPITELHSLLRNAAFGRIRFGIKHSSFFVVVVVVVRVNYNLARLLNCD